MAGLIDRFLARRGRWGRAGELARMDGHERDRIAHEVGVSTPELLRLSGREDAGDLLRGRMAALKRDPEDIARDRPAVMRDLERLCSACRHHGRCRRDLARAPQDPVWRSYCPNAATLAALAPASAGSRTS